MSTEAQALAARFEAVNDELAALIEGSSDEEWDRITASEGWPVRVVAHHIAIVQEVFVRMVERLASGATYSPSVSMDAIDASNAEHAREFAAVGKAETLTPLQTSRTAIVSAIRGLDGEQLDRIAGVFGGRELSVATVIEYVVIGHAAAHLASIRDTIGAAVSQTA